DRRVFAAAVDPARRARRQQHVAPRATELAAHFGADGVEARCVNFAIEGVARTRVVVAEHEEQRGRQREREEQENAARDHSNPQVRQLNRPRAIAHPERDASRAYSFALPQFARLDLTRSRQARTGGWPFSLGTQRLYCVRTATM